MSKPSHLLAPLLLGLLLGSGSTARAESWITQTRCDTLGLDPFRVSIEFRVVNPGPSLLASFTLWPLPLGLPEACAVQACPAPSGWLGACTASPSEKAQFGKIGGYLPASGEAGPFSITIGAVPCAFRVELFDVAIPEYFAVDTVTFTPSQPVPAAARSWGQLKARYR